MRPPVSLLNNRYQLGASLGQGSFGEVFRCKDSVSGHSCAAKLESVSIALPQLSSESKALHSFQPLRGFPRLLWTGIDQAYSILVMELLGLNLEALLQLCGGKFSLKTTLLVGEQILERLEQMHDLDYLHRDLKPENLAIGEGQASRLIYLLDFGLARKYRNQGCHIPYREHRGLTGTLRYASINAHLGLELSRRDDLESFCYLLIYFVKGALPWQGVMAAKSQRNDRVLELKLGSGFNVLCRGLPSEFALALRYVRSLRFEAEPDYAYIRRLLRDCLAVQPLPSTLVYDWSSLPQDRLQPTAALPSSASESTESGPGPAFRAGLRDKILNTSC